MIRVNASRSGLPLSVAIRWLFGIDVSHISIQFDEKEVYHSNLYGVVLASFNHFKRVSTIVEYIEFNLGLEAEESIWQGMTDVESNPYDFPGFSYFGYRGLLMKYFKTPMPSRNRWGQKKSFLCTELLSQLPDAIKPSLTADLGVTNPRQVMDLYRERFGEARVKNEIF